MPIDYQALARKHGGGDAYRPTARPSPAPRAMSTRESFDDFDSWYADRAGRLGLDPNPDAPEHFYDYRAAHEAGAEPDESGHWPSAYKKEGHPRMVVDGVNTKTGEKVSGGSEKAAGGGVDYQALARKHGAIIDEPADGAPAEDDQRLVARMMRNEEQRTGPAAIQETPWFRKPLLGVSTLDAIRVAPDVGGAVGAGLGGAGGTVFGLGYGGIPGALGGATFGGGAGEAVKELALRAIGARPGTPDVPELPEEALKNIGTEGLKQGTYELLGQAGAGTMRKLGVGAMENALSPSSDLLTEFPNVVEDTVKHRGRVGRGYLPDAKKGSEIAADKLHATSRHVDELLEEAGRQGQSYLMSTKGGSKVDRAISYVKNVAGESVAVKKLLARPTADGVNFIKSETTQPILDLINQIHLDDAQFPGKFKQLEKSVDTFLKSRSGPLTPKDLQGIQQRAYKIAKSIYDARRAGQVLGARATTRAAFNEALGKGIKEGVMNKIPGVAEGQAEKQALMGVEKAVGAAEVRPASSSVAAQALPAALGGLFGAMHGQGGVESGEKAVLGAALTWGLSRGLLHPRQLSRVGLALTHPQALALVKQFPRLLDMTHKIAVGRSRDAAEDATSAPGAENVPFWRRPGYQSTLR